MPQKKSCIKRLKQDEKRNARNKAIKSRVATAIKRIEAAAPAERAVALRTAVSLIDKAVKQGAIGEHAAARRKSKLATGASSES